MILEALIMLAGFTALAFSGRLIYRGFHAITRRFTKGETPGPDPAALMLTGFSLVTLFILLMVAYTVLFLERSLSTGSLVMAGILLMLLYDLLIFVGYRILQRMNRQALAHQLMLHKQQTEVSYYKSLEEQYGRQRVLIHDMRKHLSAIREMSRDPAVVEYVAELERSPALRNRVRICGNQLLDVILARYSGVCKENGIRFSADVRDRSVDFLSPSDMTALFGNLMENAVEAALASDNAYVELLCDLRPVGVLMVSLVNTCAATPKTDGMGGFASTKPDPGHHGLGLKSVAAVVKKHDGTLRQYYDEQANLFHTLILIQQQ